MSLVDSVRAASAAAVPLVVVETRDQPQTVLDISTALNGRPKLTWDCLNGFRALNQEGVSAISAVGAEAKDAAMARQALKAMVKLPSKSLVLCLNLHRFLEDASVAQGVQNLREPFKEDGRMLVGLGPSFADMRPELQADIVTLRVPLPTDEEVQATIMDLHDESKEQPNSKALPQMVEAVRGLPSLWTVEQAVAMSFRGSPLAVNLDALWERKIESVNATKGLKLSMGKMKYADLAGMDVIQEFVRRSATGASPFSLLLFWDEVEKALGGSTSEEAHSVDRDQVGVVLKVMEDLGWAGMILFGVPGSGKTAFADATSGEFGIRKVTMDFGKMKGRFVGDSESAIREAFDVVEGIGGSNVLVIATCNKMKSLPAEFRRRFWMGNWFFDVPTVEEQKPIKAIYETKYDLKGATWPDTTGWTGAEIRNCARLAKRNGYSLSEAAAFIVPIATADPESVEDLRNVADNRFLSVNYPGRWMRDRPEVVKVSAKRVIGG